MTLAGSASAMTLTCSTCGGWAARRRAARGRRMRRDGWGGWWPSRACEAAIIYPGWFPDSAAEWVEVGDITLTDRSITPFSPRVSIYATDAAAVAAIGACIAQIAATAPDGVVIRRLSGS